MSLEQIKIEKEENLIQKSTRNNLLNIFDDGLIETEIGNFDVKDLLDNEINEAFYENELKAMVSSILHNNSMRISDKIKLFNELQLSLGDRLNTPLKDLQVLFEKGALKSFIENNGREYKINPKNMDEINNISREDILRLVSYNSDKRGAGYEELGKWREGISNHRLLERFRDDIQDSRNKEILPIKFNEKEWIHEADLEVADFIMNHVYKYWKEKNKLPNGHQLDLTQKGKTIEFMYSELLDKANLSDINGVFPTSNVDDSGINGAKCDIVFKSGGVNIGLDIYYKPKDVDKKYRNCILNNPREIQNWPNGTGDKQSIVFPIPVNADLIIEEFKKYMEVFHNACKRVGSDKNNYDTFKDFREAFKLSLVTDGLRQEINELAQNYKDEISMIEIARGKRKISSDIPKLKNKLDKILSSFGKVENIDRSKTIVVNQPSTGFRSMLDILKYS